VADAKKITGVCEHQQGFAALESAVKTYSPPAK